MIKQGNTYEVKLKQSNRGAIYLTPHKLLSSPTNTHAQTQNNLVSIPLQLTINPVGSNPPQIGKKIDINLNININEGGQYFDQTNIINSRNPLYYTGSPNKIFFATPPISQTKFVPNQITVLPAKKIVVEYLTCVVCKQKFEVKNSLQHAQKHRKNYQPKKLEKVYCKLDLKKHNVIVKPVIQPEQQYSKPQEDVYVIEKVKKNPFQNNVFQPNTKQSRHNTPSIQYPEQAGDSKVNFDKYQYFQIPDQKQSHRMSKRTVHLIRKQKTVRPKSQKPNYGQIQNEVNLPNGMMQSK